jgi:hypothetical protein
LALIVAVGGGWLILKVTVLIRLIVLMLKVVGEGSTEAGGIFVFCAVGLLTEFPGVVSDAGPLSGRGIEEGSFVGELYEMVESVERLDVGGVESVVGGDVGRLAGGEGGGRPAGEEGAEGGG